MIRAYARQVADGDPCDLVALDELHAVIDEAMADTAVPGVKRFATWTEIADAFRITRQSAHERWGRRRSAA